jgi:hypothetical protein
LVSIGILTVTDKPDHVQFWNKTNGQLIWDFLLPQDKSVGNEAPVLWDNGESAVLLKNDEVLKLSEKGEVAWKWTKPE